MWQNFTAITFLYPRFIHDGGIYRLSVADLLSLSAIYLPRRVNGLVGWLVSWPGFEPATSQSSVTWSRVVLPFGHGTQGDWRIAKKKKGKLHSISNQSNIHRPFWGIGRQDHSSRHSGPEPISPTVSRWSQFLCRLLPDGGAMCFSVVLWNQQTLAKTASSIHVFTVIQQALTVKAAIKHSQVMSLNSSMRIKKSCLFSDLPAWYSVYVTHTHSYFTRHFYFT